MDPFTAPVETTLGHFKKENKQLKVYKGFRMKWKFCTWLRLVQKITATHNHVTAFTAETRPKQKFCLLATHAKTTTTETKTTDKKQLEKNKNKKKL